MLTKQQKTEEAEEERQKQVVITGESAKRRRRMKQEQRETDSAEIRKRGQQGSTVRKQQGQAPQMYKNFTNSKNKSRCHTANELAPEKKEE